MFNHEPLNGVYSGITPCANSHSTKRLAVRERDGRAPGAPTPPHATVEAGPFEPETGHLRGRKTGSTPGLAQLDRNAKTRDK